LDNNGLDLNNRLQASLVEIEESEEMFNSKSSIILDKSEEKALIKEECQNVDDQVTTHSENSRTKIELLIKDFIRVLK
jgi:hypothetical protein